MRTVSWLFLILSFAMGIGCAFVVRHYLFEAKPVPIIERKPTIKILVAKQTIPQGAEITAEAITFVEVPIAELPTAAITNFNQVHHRQSAYPISIGCPICEDLLLPYQEKNTETEKYIPTGMQIVSLEIEQVLLNGKTVDPLVSVANNLSPDQRIDIRWFPKEVSRGELAERKNQLLKAFTLTNEETEQGELLLENIEIYQIQSRTSTGDKRRQLPTLTLILEKEYVAHLMAVARKGRLRIVPHRQTNPIENPTETLPTQNNTTENPDNAIIVTEPSDHTAGKITDQTFDKIPNNTLTNTNDNVTNNITDHIADNNTDDITDQSVDETSGHTTDRTQETSLTMSASDSAVLVIPSPISETPQKKRMSLLFVPPEISVSEQPKEIRNEIHPSDITPSSLGFDQEKVGMSASTVHSQEPNILPRLPSYVIEIGLPVVGETLKKPAQKSYSPWGQPPSIIIEPKAETENENSLAQPLLRNRKKM